MTRYIYIDEAGTSAPEPVRVVAAIIVHADTEIRELVNELSKTIKSYVPEKYQDNFWFHAKEVYSGSAKIERSVWSFDERLDFLKNVLCLPRVFDLPIAMGSVAKGHFEGMEGLSTPKMNVQFEHSMAFCYCAERADNFLRKYLHDDEVGAIIAEDVPDMRKSLDLAFQIFKKMPHALGPDQQRASKWEREMGSDPECVQYEIRNILGGPHYVKKRCDPLLQIADACAFSFRRFLSRQTNGDSLILAMLGPSEGGHVICDPVWLEGVNSGLFNTQKYWDESQQRDFLQNQIDYLMAQKPEAGPI